MEIGKNTFLLILACTSLAMSPKLFAQQDPDGDLVNLFTNTTPPNFLDLDNDNDGILDANEKIGDQNTPPNGTFPIGATQNTSTTANDGWAYPLTPSPGKYAKQLLFFDWTGVTIDATTTFPVEKTVIHNGVTYTASITSADFSGVKKGTKSVTGIDIEYGKHEEGSWVDGNGVTQYWEWTPPLDSPFYRYNVGGRTTYKEVLNVGINGVSSKMKGVIKLSITLSAAKNGIEYPVEAVVFDGESITKQSATKYSKLEIVTSGTPFEELEIFYNEAAQPNGTYSTSPPYTATYGTETVDGLNTSTLTIYNTDTGDNSEAFSGFWTTTALKPKLDYTLTTVKSKAKDGMGFAIRLPRDTDNDGEPDYLDIDSDNDGCPDAMEGSAHLPATHSTQGTSLSDGNGNQVQSNLPGPVGSQESNMGVPNIAGNGQGIGNSQDANINNCCLRSNKNVTRKL